jgi:hypothetical protein
VQEEKATDTKVVPSSTAWPPVLTASADDVDGTYKSNTPNRVIGGSSNGGDEVDLLRLPCQGGACREACFKENFKGCTLLHHKFFYKKEC